MHLSFKHHQKVYTNRERDSLMHRLFDNPYLDWVFIILVSFILTAVFVGIGVLKYMNVQDRLAAPSSEIPLDGNKSFNAETLSRVLRQIDDRSSQRAAILKGYAGPGDPSQ